MLKNPFGAQYSALPSFMLKRCLHDIDEVWSLERREEPSEKL